MISRRQFFRSSAVGVAGAALGQVPAFAQFRGERPKQAEGVTVHRIEPPGVEFPVYEAPAYWVGYTWSVLRGLQRLIGFVEFDVLDFAEYGTALEESQVRKPGDRLAQRTMDSYQAAVVDMGVARLDGRALRLARVEDPIIVVVRYGETLSDHLSTTVSGIRAAGFTFAGVIFNGAPADKEAQ